METLQSGTVYIGTADELMMAQTYSMKTAVAVFIRKPCPFSGFTKKNVSREIPLISLFSRGILPFRVIEYPVSYDEHPRDDHTGE